MAKISRQDAKTSELVKIANERTGEILKVISPHDFTIGIEQYMESDLRVIGAAHFTGSLYIKNGALGALKLPDGTPAIKAGSDIQIVDDGDGGFTINSLASGGSGASLAPKNAPYLTYQASGDLTNERVLSATGPITFNASTAKIGFDSTSALTVASLSTNTISIGGVNIASIPYVLASPDPTLPGAKIIGAGSGVSVSTVGSSTLIAVDSSVVRTSGATFTGLISSPNISSTVLTSTTANISNLGATNITSNKIISQQITGSITKLANGSPYLQAGVNVTLSTGSDGSITIAAPAASGAPLNARYLLLNSTDSGLLTDERVLSLGNGLTGSDAGAGGFYSIKISDSQVAFLTGANFSGKVSAPSFEASNVIKSPSFSGSLTRLSNGDPYLKAGRNVSISTSSDGSITISSETGSFFSGPFLTFRHDESFPGSLSIIEGDGIEFYEDREPGCRNLTISAKLKAGNGISLNVKPTREIEISSNLSASFAPIDATYLLASSNSTLTGSRVLSSSYGIKIVDGGAGGKMSVSVDTGSIAKLSGSIFTGQTKFAAGLSGSLTRLIDGSPFLIAGTGIGITTGSNGSITIVNTGPVGDITEVIAGYGLVGGGTSGSVALEIDKTVVACLTGANFTGPVTFSSGLTGSLTKLIDGSPFIRAGDGISISTGSDGSITILNVGPTGDITQVDAGLGLIGGGTSGSVSIEADPSIIAFLTGTRFSGGVSFSSGIYVTGSSTLESTLFYGPGVFNSGLSGSLTKLADGSDYIKAGYGISLSTGSDGSITITSTGQTGSIVEVVAGLGLIGGSTSGIATLDVDVASVPFLTGANFTGAVTFSGGLTGSLTQLVDGSAFLRAGDGITLSTGSGGWVTISSTTTASVAIAGRERETKWLSSPTLAGTELSFLELDFSGVDWKEDLIEVYLNGQLQHSASYEFVQSGYGDYYVTGTNNVVFGFDLKGDDSIDVIIQGGDAAPATILNAPFVTFESASNLLNSRTVTAGAGIDISTATNGQVIISTNATGGNGSAYLSRLAINDIPQGIIDGENTIYTLNRAPSDTSQLMLWLNGQLLTQGPNYDYQIVGNMITFDPDVTPVEDDTLTAMYPYVESASRYVLNERLNMTQVGSLISGELQSTPLQSSRIMLFWNGQLLSQGESKDYIVDGKVVYLNPWMEDLDPDDIFIVCYTAIADNVYYEVNEEITFFYNSTLGLWKANLTHEPTSQNKIMLFMNGQLLRGGPSNDFVSSNNEIVMLNDEIDGDFRFYATYEYA